MYIQVRIIKSDDTIEIVKMHAPSFEEGKAIVAAQNPNYKEIAVAYAFNSAFLEDQS
jgi:hypothetical protein